MRRKNRHRYGDIAPHHDDQGEFASVALCVQSETGRRRDTWMFYDGDVRNLSRAGMATAALPCGCRKNAARSVRRWLIQKLKSYRPAIILSQDPVLAG